MKYLLWLLKAAIFFTLFAFALNNQHDATVYFFFGTYWRAPLVLVVLVAFAGGLVVGALGLPLAFVLGWLASRFDLRQLKLENRQAPKAYFRGLNFLLNEQQDQAIDALI